MVVPKQMVENHRAARLHSSVVLLPGSQMLSGATETYRVRLEIGTERPPHADKATDISWRLVTTVDIAGARDIKARRSVEVSV